MKYTLHVKIALLLAYRASTAIENQSGWTMANSSVK